MVALVATVLYGCGGNNNQTSDNNKTNNTESASTSNSSVSTGGLKIVYVNIDTLQSQYEFAKRVRKDLKQKENEVRADLSSRGQTFQNQVASFQRTAGTMTLNNVEQTKKSLAARQQELEAYGRVRQRELLSESDKLSQKLRENINDFLKRYAEKNSIDLILTKSVVTSSVMYGKAEMDVTMEILKGLNEEYKSGKTGDIKSDTKKDTTKTDTTKK
ncbi:hypothetical protein BKI52_09725 [marine bacterium AO1-C]|nr:hypothetical protein BKI52_09725 [marine bacterium AO1-C]